MLPPTTQPPSRLARATRFITLLSLAGAIGCSEDCPWMKRGQRVEIQIGEVPEGWPAPDGECQGNWGFTPNVVVSGEVVDVQPGSTDFCRAGVLESPGVNGWTWTQIPNNDEDTLASLLTDYTIAKDGCSATLQTRLTGRNDASCGTGKHAECAYFIDATPNVERLDACPALCRQIKLNVVVNRL